LELFFYLINKTTTLHTTMENIGKLVIRIGKIEVISLIENQYGTNLNDCEKGMIREGLYNMSILSDIMKAHKQGKTIHEFLESSVGKNGTFTDILEPDATMPANTGILSEVKPVFSQSKFPKKLHPCHSHPC
jgi:hypothetical protein